jgi:hypothetical protein
VNDSRELQEPVDVFVLVKVPILLLALKGEGWTRDDEIYAPIWQLIQQLP